MVLIGPSAERFSSSQPTATHDQQRHDQQAEGRRTRHATGASLSIVASELLIAASPAADRSCEVHSKPQSDAADAAAAPRASATISPPLTGDASRRAETAAAGQRRVECVRLPLLLRSRAICLQSGVE